MVIFMFNSSTKSNFEQPESFVKSQKLGRPMSPITIYKPQITSVLSISSRVTGAGLGVGIYGFAALYSFNLLDPTAFVSLVHSFPVLVGLAKAAIAYPVAFHSANGIRHLIWDTGLFLKVRDVYATGYTVLAFTAIAGTALLFL
ncbi:hypothetical protein HDU92_002769 [Lobulomyces angularis]|nr:hypothetical protein HDU92_002769 [Lobulomyces angularis]